MSDTLTFRELCEAIRDGKVVQWSDGSEWMPSTFSILTPIGTILDMFDHVKYRIKPAPTYKYQWLIKDPGHGFFITANWHTREQAERQFGFSLAEPYLPSERVL